MCVQYLAAHGFALTYTPNERRLLAALYAPYNREVDFLLGWDTLHGRPGVCSKWIDE